MQVDDANEHQKLKELAKNFKMDKGIYDEMQRKAREARNLLNI